MGDIENDEMNYKMQAQMKQSLENVPRFTYKLVKIFMNKSQMQEAINDLMNIGIMDLKSKTLTENYVEEIYDSYIFLPREGYAFVKALLSGGILGGIIGILQGKGFISLPIFNPASGGGAIVSAILLAAIGAILCGVLISICVLFKPISNAKAGDCILVVYSDVENKNTIESIIQKYATVDIF